MPVEHAQRLTFFGDDDVTPIVNRDGVMLGAVDPVTGAVTEPTVSVDPDDERPFFHYVDSLPRSSVDLLRGKASIGECSVRILDRRRIAGDQDSGWFTHLLADIGGYSNLAGRRALLEEYVGGAWVTILNGIVGDIGLDDNLVDYTLSLRDIRERARRLTLFGTAVGVDGMPTTSVFPRGVIGGWGWTGTEWVVPPVEPLLAGFSETYNPYNIPLDSWQFGWQPMPGIMDGDYSVPARFRVTDTIRQLLAARFEPDESGRNRRIMHTHIRLLWRVPGTEPWNVIVPNWMQLQEVGGYGDDGEHVSGGSHVVFTPLSGVGSLPPGGGPYEFLIGWAGEPSEDTPLHIEMPWADFLYAVNDGHFSRDPEGNPVPIGLPLDEASVDAIQEPVVARIVKPIGDKEDDDDGRRAALSWLEGNFFQPVASAPAVERAEVRVIRYALPPAGEPVHEVNDSNCIDATWAQSPADAVTLLTFKFRQHVRVPVEDDPEGTQSKVDTIATRNVTIRRYADPAYTARIGEQKVDVDTELFSAVMTKEAAQNPTLQTVAERTLALALALADMAFDRFVLGGQALKVVVQESASRTWRVGDWLVVGVSWLPDYATGRRGMSRFAQIQAVLPSKPGERAFECIDAGPDNQPFAVPVLGAMIANADGTVTMPVASVPVGAEALVQYAVADIQPDADSPLWTRVDRHEPADPFVTPVIPSGETVWRRVRAEGTGRRPSAWVGFDSIVAATRPSLRSFRAVLNDNGSVTVYWTPGTTTAGVRLSYLHHNALVAADFAAADGSVDVDATLGEYTFPGGVTLSIDPAQVFSVQGVPYVGFAAGAVSGASGVAHVRTVAVPPASRDLAVAEFEVQVSNPSTDLIQIDVVPTAFLASWSAWAAKGVWPTVDGTQHGALDDRYRIVDGAPAAQTSAQKRAVGGEWFVAVEGYNDWGDAGERVEATIDLDVAEPPGGTGAISTVSVDKVGGAPDHSGGDVVVSWAHNQTVEDDVAGRFTLRIERRIDYRPLVNEAWTGINPKAEHGGGANALFGSWADPDITLVSKQSSNDPNYHHLEYTVYLDDNGVWTGLKYTAATNAYALLTEVA